MSWLRFHEVKISIQSNYLRGRGIFFTTRCRVIAWWVYQRQLPYNLLPATYNIQRPKTQERLLPIQAAIANCLLEAPGRSSCREKNTPTPQLPNNSNQNISVIIFRL
jgi:hypothetical protein